MFFAVAFLATLLMACADNTFKVKFDVDRLDGKKGEVGSFVVEVHPEWAPLGAARIKDIVREKVWDTARFFRVVPDWEASVVQWGIPGKPSVAAKWKDATIADDPVKSDIKNLKGYITFVMSGPDTRTTQVLVNLKHNTNLDSIGFPPFGKVIEGMDVVERINSAHREQPNQDDIQVNGNMYLKREFPDLSFIKKVSFVDEEGEL